MHPLDQTSGLWFPVHPKWLILLRLVGVLLAGAAIYGGVATGHWSLPGILLLWLIFVRPEIRPRTPFYLVGSVLHWLLCLIVFGVVAVLIYSTLVQR